MHGTIYLIGKDGKLEQMNRQLYDNEDILQKYLEDYPELLAGDQMNQSASRKWLFIKREMGVPEEESGGDRWSLDHLFLDQDGIPTLVEVKRSTDTRSRREVVAQMLDYAANAVLYWSVDKMRASFEQNCEDKDLDPVEAVREFLGQDSVDAAENYWEKVKTNLQAEKIRLVFFADYIQPELRRIVEFLNGQMDPAEILAVEVPQYVGETQTAMVPRVLGLTSKAEAVKGVARKTTSWNEQTFMEEMERVNPDVLGIAKKILQWAKDNGIPIQWGTGRTLAGMNLVLRHLDSKYFIGTVDTDQRMKGRVWVSWTILRRRPPFNDEDRMSELLGRMDKIPGANVPSNPRNNPTFPLDLLKEEHALTHYLDTLEWIVQMIQEV